MNVVPNEQRYVHEANVYKLLSLLYCHPNEDTHETIEYLRQEILNFFPQKIDLVLKMKTDLEENPLQEIKIAHAKLFMGPFDLIAPPYSSLYLDGARKVMGDSTMDALNFYRKAGLNPDPDFKEPPDHITTELEFVYYLTAKYLESGDNHWLSLRQQFMDTHLNRWAKQFVNKIKDSKTTFYENLALLTEDILHFQ